MPLAIEIIRCRESGRVRAELILPSKKNVRLANDVVIATIHHELAGADTLVALAVMDNQQGKLIKNTLEALAVKAYESGLSNSVAVSRLSQPSYPPP